MREELRTLLAEAGVEPELLSGSWNRTLVINNIGSVALRSEHLAGEFADRGFHMMLLDPEGIPVYHCKCRPALSGGRFHREAEVLLGFGGHPDSAPIVPTTAVVHNERMEVQVARFLQGTRLDHALPGMDESRRDRVIGRVLEASAILSQVALELPGVFPGRSDPAPLEGAAQESLESLAALGVADQDVEVFRKVLADCGSVPASPQHRDLWPENVFVSPDGSCTLVDFDHFGEVTVPLFDALHFVRTAGEHVSAHRGSWLDQLEGGGPLYRSQRHALRQEVDRLALVPDAVGGCILFYLIHVAVATFTRGAPEAFWGRLRDELPGAARRLRESGSARAFAESLLASP